MSDVSGIPNLGIPAMSGFNGGGGTNNSNWFAPPGAGLNNAAAAQAMMDRFMQNQAATLGAAQIPQGQLYGGGSFGAQPAHYAGVGAAYGRATGGFGGYGASNADPFTPVSTPSGGDEGSPTRVPVASSPFDTGNAGGVPYLSGGGMPFGGGGFSGRGSSPFISGAPPINMSSGGAPFGGGGFSSGGGGNIFDQAHNPFAGGAGSPGSFADRFAPVGGYRSGTPSQYTTEPYTDASGRTHQPNIPSGYETPFSFDNPGGALPASRGSPFPIMGAGGGAPSDTLTSGDRAIRAPSIFSTGASGVPYPNVGGQAFPGEGIGSNQPTNQRDMLANIMSGSQGNEGAQNIGRGFSQAGGGGGGSPPSMSPFGAMPSSSGFGRAFQMPSAMGGASPKPPALTSGNWGTSSAAPTGGVGAGAMGGAFSGRSPQSYINSNFGEMQTPQFSPGNIVMGDRLRGQGPPSLSPFMGSNAFRPR